MNNILTYIGIVICALLLVAGTSGSANAQDLIYEPKNPAFGGSPVNYQWLLNSANTQNKFQQQGGFQRQDPLANFEESLQRQVLSQLTRQIISDRFGNIDLSQQSTFEFGEFNIQVNPGPDGIRIDIRNILTGESTNITVPSGFNNIN